jgi:hypothetical protein
MLATDEKTCKEIDDTVCKKPATEANEAYCECIGLGKRSTLLHSVIKKQVVNKGAVANAVKHFMTLTENDVSWIVHCVPATLKYFCRCLT